MLLFFLARYNQLSEICENCVFARCGVQSGESCSDFTLFEDVHDVHWRGCTRTHEMTGAMDHSLSASGALFV